MRKIPAEYENPIDHYFLLIVEKQMYILEKMGISPNQVTTLGNLVRVASLWFLKKGELWWFLFAALFGHFMDCVDGHLARSTNQETVFGDYYDHFSDVIYHILLTIIVFQSNTLNGVSLFNKLIILAGTLLLVFLLFFHLGCQENHYDDSSSGWTLSGFKSLCNNHENIYWSRYFGCGTFILTFYILIFFFYKK